MRRLLLAAAVLLAGCVRADGSAPVTLRFWAMGREGEVVQELIDDFERENPGVRVIVQQIPWGAAHEKLLTAYVGRSTPDLAQLGNTWISEFVALQAIEPLDRRLADVARYLARRLLRRHLGHQRDRRRPLRGAVVRGHPRALLPQRSPGRGRLRLGARELGRVAGRDGEDEAGGGRRAAIPIFLPTNEYTPWIVFGLQTALAAPERSRVAGSVQRPRLPARRRRSISTSSIGASLPRCREPRSPTSTRSSSAARS